MNNRFKAGVPAPKPSGGDVARFVAAAPRKNMRPWLVQGVRDDLRKELNVRLPERLMIKVKAYAQDQGRPLRDVVEDFLEQGWNREAKRLGWDV
jgi:hypothetical protein